MDESRESKLVLQQQLDMALQELECGRLEEAITCFQMLLQESRASMETQYEGEALYYLHILDGGLTLRKLRQNADVE